MTRLHPELLSCERHSNHYGGGGVLSHVIFPNGTVASIPQKAQELLNAVALARLEMADPQLFDGALLPLHPSRPVVTVRAPILAQLDSPESVDAGIANMPNRESQRGRVLAYLEEWGPATDEQIQDALGMEGSTERPRRVELAQAGLIKKYGVAQTRSGRRAALWGVR